MSVRLGWGGGGDSRKEGWILRVGDWFNWSISFVEGGEVIDLFVL